MLKRIVLIFMVAATALVTGCATNRSEVAIERPSGEGQSVTKSRTVLVRSVTDERVFEDKPSEPSVPSLKGGASSASADVKARAFARKRNGYGKALGDVVLKGGATVTDVMRDNVVAAFREAGYRVTTNPAEAGASPLMVDVHIKQFWAWMIPGAFVVKLDANVETSITAGTAAPIVVKTHAEHASGVVTEGQWAGVMQHALNDYRKELAAKAAALR